MEMDVARYRMSKRVQLPEKLSESQLAVLSASLESDLSWEKIIEGHLINPESFSVLMKVMADLARNDQWEVFSVFHRMYHDDMFSHLECSLVLERVLDIMQILLVQQPGTEEEAIQQYDRISKSISILSPLIILLQNKRPYNPHIWDAVSEIFYYIREFFIGYNRYEDPAHIFDLVWTLIEVPRFIYVVSEWVSAGFIFNPHRNYESIVHAGFRVAPDRMPYRLPRRFYKKFSEVAEYLAIDFDTPLVECLQQIEVLGRVKVGRIVESLGSDIDAIQFERSNGSIYEISQSYDPEIWFCLAKFCDGPKFCMGPAFFEESLIQLLKDEEFSVLSYLLKVYLNNFVYKTLIDSLQSLKSGGFEFTQSFCEQLINSIYASYFLEEYFLDLEPGSILQQPDIQYRMSVMSDALRTLGMSIPFLLALELEDHASVVAHIALVDSGKDEFDNFNALHFELAVSAGYFELAFHITKYIGPDAFSRWLPFDIDLGNFYAFVTDVKKPVEEIPVFVKACWFLTGLRDCYRYLCCDLGSTSMSSRGAISHHQLERISHLGQLFHLLVTARIDADDFRQKLKNQFHSYILGARYYQFISSALSFYLSDETIYGLRAASYAFVGGYEVLGSPMLAFGIDPSYSDPVQRAILRRFKFLQGVLFNSVSPLDITDAFNISAVLSAESDQYIYSQRLTFQRAQGVSFPEKLASFLRRPTKSSKDERFKTYLLEGLCVLDTDDKHEISSDDLMGAALSQLPSVEEPVSEPAQDDYVLIFALFSEVCRYFSQEKFKADLHARLSHFVALLHGFTSSHIAEPEFSRELSYAKQHFSPYFGTDWYCSLLENNLAPYIQASDFSQLALVAEVFIRSLENSIRYHEILDDISSAPLEILLPATSITLPPSAIIARGISRHIRYCNSTLLGSLSEEDLVDSVEMTCLLWNQSIAKTQAAKTACLEASGDSPQSKLLHMLRNDQFSNSTGDFKCRLLESLYLISVGTNDIPTAGELITNTVAALESGGFEYQSGIQAITDNTTLDLSMLDDLTDDHLRHTAGVASERWNAQSSGFFTRRKNFDTWFMKANAEHPHVQLLQLLLQETPRIGERPAVFLSELLSTTFSSQVALDDAVSTAIQKILTQYGFQPIDALQGDELVQNLYDFAMSLDLFSDTDKAKCCVLLIQFNDVRPSQEWFDGMGLEHEKNAFDTSTAKVAVLEAMVSAFELSTSTQPQSRPVVIADHDELFGL